ncbi:hypothetical protein ACSBR1_005259 [Camellia fascicularis]
MEPTQVVVKGTVEYVRSCCEANLKHLGVDYIDLYYVHRIETSVPIEEIGTWNCDSSIFPYCSWVFCWQGSCGECPYR